MTAAVSKSVERQLCPGSSILVKKTLELGRKSKIRSTLSNQAIEPR